MIARAIRQTTFNGDPDPAVGKFRMEFLLGRLGNFKLTVKLRCVGELNWVLICSLHSERRRGRQSQRDGFLFFVSFDELPEQCQSRKAKHVFDLLL